jgi:hypothetical protein
MAHSVERREVVTERPRRILPALGRKGGERVETDEMRTWYTEGRIRDRS